MIYLPTSWCQLVTSLQNAGWISLTVYIFGQNLLVCDTTVTLVMEYLVMVGAVHCSVTVSTGQLKECDGTRAENRFRLSAKRTNPFKSAGGRQFSRLLAAELCASAVVMLDTPCSEVVWRVLATHSIRQFPLHFSSCASPCAITFQLDCTNLRPLIK